MREGNNDYMMTVEKWQTRVDILLRWIRLGQSGIFLEDLIRKRGYKSIGVYGYVSLTDCVIYELKDSNKVELKCVIDKKGDNILIDFPAFCPEEIMDLSLDVIILMPVDDYEVIRNQLEKYTSVDIRTIEEILYEL